MMGLGGQSKYTNDSHFTKFNEIIYKLKKKKSIFLLDITMALQIPRNQNHLQEVHQVHTVRFYRPEYTYFIKLGHLCTQVVQWLRNI